MRHDVVVGRKARKVVGACSAADTHVVCIIGRDRRSIRTGCPRNDTREKTRENADRSETGATPSRFNEHCTRTHE